MPRFSTLYMIKKTLLSFLCGLWNTQILGRYLYFFWINRVNIYHFYIPRRKAGDTAVSSNSQEHLEYNAKTDCLCTASQTRKIFDWHRCFRECCHNICDSKKKKNQPSKSSEWQQLKVKSLAALIFFPNSRTGEINNEHGYPKHYLDRNIQNTSDGQGHYICIKLLTHNAQLPWTVWGLKVYCSNHCIHFIKFYCPVF